MKKGKYREVFNKIYADDLWDYGSGYGSLLENNHDYIKVIQSVLKKYNIQSVVDFGCGDWQFSKAINWGNVEYLGYDVADCCISNNIKFYAKDNIHFQYTPENWSNIEGADLLICKDVLQHFDTESINHFIATVLPKYKYALITNTIRVTDTIGTTNGLNTDILLGNFRPLDLRLAPFNISMKRIYTIYEGESDIKYTLLYEQGKSFDMKHDFKKEHFEICVARKIYRFGKLLKKIYAHKR